MYQAAALWVVAQLLTGSWVCLEGDHEEVGDVDEVAGCQGMDKLGEKGAGFFVGRFPCMHVCASASVATLLIMDVQGWLSDVSSFLRPCVSEAVAGLLSYAQSIVLSE